LHSTANFRSHPLSDQQDGQKEQSEDPEIGDRCHSCGFS